MSKFWRIILYSEAVGVVLALALYFLWATAGPGLSGWQENQVIGFLQLLCPGSLIFMMCIDCEIGTDPGIMWLLIVVGVNLAAYAVLGAILAALLAPANNEKS